MYSCCTWLDHLRTVKAQRVTVVNVDAHSDALQGTKKLLTVWYYLDDDDDGKPGFDLDLDGEPTLAAAFLRRAHHPSA